MWDHIMSSTCFWDAVIALGVMVPWSVLVIMTMTSKSDKR